jgi:steroid delta-isomerase-like uncharacterized protein
MAMSEKNKAIVRRAYEAMRKGDLATLADVIADDFVEHETMFDVPPTKEGTLQLFKALRASFPDLTMQLQDMIAEGDKVFIRATMIGTHQGEFLGVPATGKQINVPMGDFLRFRDGKVVEHWGVTDTGVMMEQLGVAEVPH